MDKLLSLALSAVMGICVLLLDGQLYDCPLCDVVLPQMWRILGPVESVVGVLMCGLSASFLFAMVTRLVGREARLTRELAEPL